MNLFSECRRRSSRAPSRLAFERLEQRQLLAVTTVEAWADTFVRDGQYNAASTVLDSRYSFVPYIQFNLAELNIEQITSATLKVTKTAGIFGENNISAGSFGVYGLTSQAGNTPQDWFEATLSGGANVGLEWNNDSGTDGIDRSRLFNLDAEDGANVTETISSSGADNTPETLTGPDLVAFLNSRVDDNGYVTFIIPNENSGGNQYGIASKEHPDVALRPQLVLTYTEGDPLPPDVDAYPDDPVVLPRQVEKLDRGVIALRRSAGEVFVSWRLLGDDPADVSFKLYRSTNGVAATPIATLSSTDGTNFVDATANTSVDNAYFVRAIVDGVEQAASESAVLDANAAIQQHLDIPLVIPAGGTVPDYENPGQFLSYTYDANDASVGDLDGDGDYEVILKWNPTNAKDNAHNGYTGNVYVDAYSLTPDEFGNHLLWRIDLGVNIRAGAHYTQMLVYDFDGDGRSEVVMKTAPGTIDGQGAEVLLPGDNASADYRNSAGRPLSGPEYLTVFDGATGAELQTIEFPLERQTIASWGDNYGNRSERYLASVAYLDGNRPSIVWARGYYGPQPGLNARNEVVALDWRDGQLSQLWRFNASTADPATDEYIAQGTNAMVTADVDGDGRDEVIHGAAALDDDGSGLYSTELGHGDAIHVTDIDPTNPGLEVFMVHESPSQYQSYGRDAGGELRDAQTGELLFQIPSNNDVGRGVAGDIDPNNPGFEFWGSINEGTRMVYNASGKALYGTGGLSFNMLVWWDGDLSREMLDGTTISKLNYPDVDRLVADDEPGFNNTAHLDSNNGSKANPSLAADLLGDWREEVLWRRSDNTALEIWSTTIETDTRLTTLMHDTQYRTSVAGQNIAYNQPSHPSYWIGEGMPDPPAPPLFFGGELQGDYNADGAVDAADYAVWRNALVSQELAADGDHNGVVDQSDYGVWRSHYGDTAASPASTAQPTLSAAQAITAAAVAESAISEEAVDAVYTLDQPLASRHTETDATLVEPLLQSPFDPSLLLLLQDATLPSDQQYGDAFELLSPDEDASEDPTTPDWQSAWTGV